MITLLTDFGTSDTYVGQIKGVILSLAPAVNVVDLTHEISPGDVFGAACALDSAVDAFAHGAIHVAVVDPGVGSNRRALAVQTPHATFIGPDNGIFTMVLNRLPVVRAVSLTNDRFHRSSVSATFHGRDIFAAVAGYLAAGAEVRELGEPADELVQLEVPTPAPVADGLELHVIAIDHFGNVITDLSADDLPQGVGRGVLIHAGGVTVEGTGSTFSDAAPGEAIAYIGSSGRLEIAVRDGNAAEVLKLGRGSRLLLQQR